MSDTTRQILSLERYKYILDQKKNLNERTFKIASIYQVLMIAIASAQFTIISDASAGRLDKGVATDASWGLFVIFSLVTTLMIALIVGGICAWFGYRKDENEIELLIAGTSREMPKLGDAFKWYESYLIVAAIAGEMLYLLSMVFIITPRL